MFDASFICSQQNILLANFCDLCNWNEGAILFSKTREQYIPHDGAGHL